LASSSSGKIAPTNNCQGDSSRNDARRCNNRSSAYGIWRYEPYLPASLHSLTLYRS